uniref:Membrane protein BRI3 n=1 Tax=Geotrypetes seraphini TaxID=260995 RepID=A0A6P8P3W5_GEOSA|nr:brain protein I3 [Geotrypetes seraphini]
MDNKPLLQERPPAYSPVMPGGYEYGQPNNYGAIPPPPYSYPSASGYPIAPPPLAPQGPPQPKYPSTYTIIQQPVTTTSVVVVGGCPACRVGVLEDSFTCLGVCCAILFFPIGLLLCFALKQRQCPNCGATFG